MTRPPPPWADKTIFSLTAGGPAGALFRRLKLVHSGRGGDAMRVALILGLGTWLPLVLLCGFEGVLVKGVKIPLFYDFGPYIRFLFALPMLILIELVIDARIRETLDHFLTSGLIVKRDENRFYHILKNTAGLRDSPLATIALVGITIALAWRSIHVQINLNANSWAEPVIGTTLSYAGYWYACIALPIYQFILLRWGYRIIVWGYLLSEIARMDLHLTATHPDRAGGLGFVGRSIVPFGLIGLILGAVLSATIASRVLFGGETLSAMLPPYGVLVVLSLMISIGPLLFFIPKLHRLKRQGLLQYSRLATIYTLDFQKKWIVPEAASDETLLGSADIQSLADLGNSFQVIEEMKLVPMSRINLITALALNLIPALPLALTVMPLKDILHKLIQIFV